MISHYRFAGRLRPFRQAFLILCRFALLLGTGFAADPVIVRTQESDELFANPGMGWETFNRPRGQDKNLPGWIPSTVEYARWSWSQLEPQQGKLNLEFLDQELRKAHESGQKLAFRVKCCTPNNSAKAEFPDWLAGLGGKVFTVDSGHGKPPSQVPDLDDPVILKSHLNFIRMLGERYDGNPDLDHVDLGSVGWWGEWHLEPAKMPTLENQMKVVNAYLDAFKKTPLLMLAGAGECTTYAVQHGSGWRVDSFGDLGSATRKYNHSIGDYPASFTRNGVLDVWKKAPVAFEPRDSLADLIVQAPVEREVPGTHQKLSIAHPLRWIFNYGLALHGSYFNSKSAKFPEDPEFKSELQRFLKRLGYRLVLTELSHPAEVKIGSQLPLSMKWRNVGAAPCYRPYRVACQLSDNHGFRRVFVGSLTVNHWMPGSIELFTEDFFKEPSDLPLGELYQVNDSVALPSDIPPGEYVLSVGVVDEHSETPVIRLGIMGRNSEGWYPVSKLKIIP